MFATLWLATLVSGIGTWMNEVGAGWLMTSLAPEPLMVALVQAAATLPVFLLAVPAGAMADLIDKRRLLLAANLFMFVVAALMAFLVATGAMTPELLLFCTFLLGAGAAVVAPAWQAIVPGLVPRSELAAAISLNGVGINLGRAVGPAVAGVLITAVGLYAPFLLNALSFVGILVALWLWRGEPPQPSRLAPETPLVAIASGLRYARHSRALMRTLGRAAGFFVFAAAYWALLPLVARDLLDGGSGLYGLLLGCVGGGALLSAALLPRLRQAVEINQLVLAGAIATGAAVALTATIPLAPVAATAAVLAGASWIAVLSSIQIAAQTALPQWVRARGLSLYLTTFFGTMTLGSVVWGSLGQWLGIMPALLLAAAGLLVAAFTTSRIRLSPGDGSEHMPSLHWPAPPVLPTDAEDAGPVLVTIDYHVRPESKDEFLLLMRQRRETRLRDGAYDWRLLRLLEEDGLLREAFSVHSWTDHLRQHERVTEAERQLQARIARLLQDDGSPLVRHCLPVQETTPS